jgi:hypothetical protein
MCLRQTASVKLKISGGTTWMVGLDQRRTAFALEDGHGKHIGPSARF